MPQPQSQSTSPSSSVDDYVTWMRRLLQAAGMAQGLYGVGSQIANYASPAGQAAAAAADQAGTAAGMGGEAAGAAADTATSAFGNVPLVGSAITGAKGLYSMFTDPSGYAMSESTIQPLNPFSMILDGALKAIAFGISAGERRDAKKKIGRSNADIAEDAGRARTNALYEGSEPYFGGGSGKYRAAAPEDQQRMFDAFTTAEGVMPQAQFSSRKGVRTGPESVWFGTGHYTPAQYGDSFLRSDPEWRGREAEVLNRTNALATEFFRRNPTAPLPEYRKNDLVGDVLEGADTGPDGGPGPRRFGYENWLDAVTDEMARNMPNWGGSGTGGVKVRVPYDPNYAGPSGFNRRFQQGEFSPVPTGDGGGTVPAYGADVLAPPKNYDAYYYPGDPQSKPYSFWLQDDLDSAPAADASAVTGETTAPAGASPALKDEAGGGAAKSAFGGGGTSTGLQTAGAGRTTGTGDLGANRINQAAALFDDEANRRQGGMGVGI